MAIAAIWAPFEDDRVWRVREVTRLYAKLARGEDMVGTRPASNKPKKRIRRSQALRSTASVIVRRSVTITVSVTEIYAVDVDDDALDGF